MAHRHLILAYAAAFTIHLLYLGWIGLKRREVRTLEREAPTYPAQT